MAKSGGNVVGNLIVLAAVVVGIYILLRYLSSQTTAQAKTGSGGLAAGAAGGLGAAATSAASGLKTLLTGISDFWKGQLAAFQLPTTSPTSNALIPAGSTSSASSLSWWNSLGFSPDLFGSSSAPLLDPFSAASMSGDLQVQGDGNAAADSGLLDGVGDAGSLPAGW